MDMMGVLPLFSASSALVAAVPMPRITSTEGSFISLRAASRYALSGASQPGLMCRASGKATCCSTPRSLSAVMTCWRIRENSQYGPASK
jgi:hypothetical protein